MRKKTGKSRTVFADFELACNMSLGCAESSMSVTANGSCDTVPVGFFAS
jgi:hypothetical protein